MDRADRAVAFKIGALLSIPPFVALQLYLSSINALSAAFVAAVGYMIAVAIAFEWAHGGEVRA